MKKHYLVIIFAAMALFACKSDRENVNPNPTPPDGLEGALVPDGFNYEMEAVQGVTINTSLKNKRFTLMSEDFKPVVEGVTGDDGGFFYEMNIPTATENMYIKFSDIGIPQDSFAIKRSDAFTFEFNGDRAANNRTEAVQATITGDPALGFNYLGTWNEYGFPSYTVLPYVAASTDLLDAINVSLPESYPVPDYNPQYLSSEIQEIEIKEDDTEITLTFIHEGAGYRNVLGFYTYPTGTTPTLENISRTIVLPNASYYGSGGALYSGDKFELGSFDEGTTLGFFLIADGFNRTTYQPSNTSQGTFYSRAEFNPESDPELQKHMVLLYYAPEDQVVIGFEDIFRNSPSCDQDFNDVMFTLKYSKKIDVNDMPNTSVPKDDDDDGLDNKFDRDPNDPNRTYYEYYPNSGGYASLAYEDLWPSKGDYDFNDLVVDYQYQIVKNGDYGVTFIEAEFVIKAIGASYLNGFAINFPALLPSDIKSVKLLTSDPDDEPFKKNLFETVNGVESGITTSAVIPIFANAYDIMPSPEGKSYVNVIQENQYTTPDTIRMSIELNTPLIFTEIGQAPFDPFLIADQGRGTEVHLPGKPNTALADIALFRQHDDDTRPNIDKYYKSGNNLPWAINIPTSFAYPKEGKAINTAHLKFIEWVQSGGTSATDWYMDETDYRNTNNIYSAP